MASSELLPPAPLATACDVDGVLGSPAKKRGEGSPEAQHASFYHVAIIQNGRKKRDFSPIWFRALSTKRVARTNADQKDRQHPQSKSCDTPSSKQAAFFEDCKINPITNDSNRQTCLFSLSVFPPFLSNLILQDSAFSADYLF